MDDETYEKSQGNAGLDGVQFQLDLLIVVLLNAFRDHKNKNWKISSENKKAGKFDDIVFELAGKNVFLQSKFRKKRKIIRNELFSCKPDAVDFSLPKYFFSYLEIKPELIEKTFIICTNKEVNPKGLHNVLVRHNAESDSLLHCEGATCSFLTFNEDILPDFQTNAEKYFNENLQSKNTGKAEKTSENTGKARNSGQSMGKVVIEEESLKKFLKNLQFFHMYPSGGKLHKIIEGLLSQSDDPWCKTSHHEIYRKVEDWYKHPKGEYLTELHIKAMLCEIRSDKYCESLKNFNVSFDNNDLGIALWQKLNFVKVTEANLLQILKIYHGLQFTGNKTLFVNPEDAMDVQKQAVEAFSLPRYTFLVLFWAAIKDDIAKNEIISEVRKILSNSKDYKKFILVGEDKLELENQLGLKDVYQIDVSVTFQDLSNTLQDKLLKTENVLFQNERVSLAKLLQTQAAEDYTKLLDSAMLEHLLRGNEVKVGVRPLELDEDSARLYISRRFQTKIEETKDIRNVLTEENLCSLNEKTILISDTAGMGKSTALTRMAATIKKSHRHLWVIKINLNHYTRALHDFVKTERNQIIAAELLNSLEATKMTDKFEKFVFSMSEKVVLMLDGVDEISSRYTNLILSLLSHCQQAPNFAKVFVTARPHLDLNLKGARLFKLLPLTRIEQTDFLTNYWMGILNIDNEDKDKCKQYADKLISKISSWTISSHYCQNYFTDVPLQIRMIAEIFADKKNIQWMKNWEGCKEYLERGEGGTDPKLPEKFNIAELYETFVAKKRDVFLDKGTESLMATPALLNTFHCGLAVSTLLPEHQKLFKTHLPEDNHTEEHVLKIGIAQKLGDRVQFIHRTFAEYFLAIRIVEELKVQNPDANLQKLLIDIIFPTEEFENVRAFLDIFLKTVSLPTNIFRKYRMLKYEEANLELIFRLTVEGHASIIRLILENVDFKPIKTQAITVTNWRLRLPFRTRNTLSDLAVLVRQAGVNIKGKDGETLLHLAVKTNQLDVANFLIEQGADVNIKNGSGHAAILLATHSKNCDIVDCIVKHGADVNTRDDMGYPILHTAVSVGASDIVACLLQHGADIKVKASEDDKTLLHLATTQKNWDIVKSLVEHGADVDEKDEWGLTVLHRAVIFGSLDIVVFLVKHSADVYARDNEGLTALQVAAKLNKMDIVEYLQKQGECI